MKSGGLLVSAAVVAGLTMIAAPARANRGGGHGRSHGSGGGGGHSASHSSAPRRGSARSVAAPRSAGGVRSSSAARAFSAPRAAIQAPRSVAVAPRGFGARPYAVAPRIASFVRVAPRLIGPRGVVVAGPLLARPYYAFRPRVIIGVGLWAGYPVPYPYAYADPYASVDPYGDAAATSVYPATTSAYPPASSDVYAASTDSPSAYPPSSDSQPGDLQSGYSAPTSQPAPTEPAQSSSADAPPVQATAGAVSFEITPGTASVYVDKMYVGIASSFDPGSEPLTLAPGRHHFEVQAAGYRTISFDTDVEAGQVIPYQGAMEKQ